MTKTDETRKLKSKIPWRAFLKIHQRALSTVKIVSNQEMDNTFTVKTFPDLKLSLSVKNIFLVKKIHNLNIVFFFIAGFT